MKTNGFVKLLRKIIREEVSSAIKQALNESNSINNVTTSMNLSEIAEDPMPNKPVAKKKKQYTKNSMLNDLLNETATNPMSQEQMDWSTMNFKSDMAQSFGTERASARPSLPITTTGINGEAVNMSDQGVATAVKAMTKDYSGVMAAMREKDKAKGKKVV